MSELARSRMIDCLRGGSAIAVALFHFNEPFPALSDIYHRGLKWGWLGVSVFFVVSGFCIAAARQKDDIVSFWYRRLVRIFPPYWASLGVVLAVVVLRVATTGTNDVTPLPKDFVGWFYTLVALIKPASPVAGMNWAYWSLGYELAFYLLMGALVFRRSGMLLVLFSLLAFFVRGYPFDQWGLFGLGAACYYFTAKHFRTAALVGVFCIADMAVVQSWPEAVAGVGAALLILFPPEFVMRPFFNPLRQAGLFSYSLYLIHVPIGCFLVPHCFLSRWNRDFGVSVLQDLILLSTCCLVAWLFYRWVEKPSHELARRIGFREPTQSALAKSASPVQ